MKDSKMGVALSVGMFILLILIDTVIYNNVMPISLGITLIVMHVVAYKQLIPEKSYTRYSIYLLAIIAAVFLSLPEFTHQQAKEQIIAAHNLELKEVGNMPLDREGSWNPFVPSWGYLFEGISPEDDDVQIHFLFIPDTGKFFEIVLE